MIHYCLPRLAHRKLITSFKSLIPSPKLPGSAINNGKSGFTCSKGTTQLVKDQLGRALDMSHWNDPGKYLGLPSIWGRSKTKALEWILDKVKGKMEGWKESYLNQAGKEVLIKAVIQTIPSYAMAVVLFPKSFCKTLNSAVAKFWWKSQAKEREAFTGVAGQKLLPVSVRVASGSGNSHLKTYPIWVNRPGDYMKNPIHYGGKSLRLSTSPTLSSWKCNTRRSHHGFGPISYREGTSC